MKSRTLTLIFVMTLFAATAISVQLFAQEQHKTAGSAFSASHVLHTGKGSFRPSPGMRAAAKGETNGTLAAGSGSALLIPTFEAPGAGKGFEQGTVPLSINGGGTFTGAVIDSHGNVHGLLGDTTGMLKSFDVPGAVETVGQGINNKGAIVGYYADADGHICGFVRSPDGSHYDLLTVPGAEITFAMNINDAGTVSGTYFDRRDTQHGFVLKQGEFTSFDAPGAENTDVVLNGMNAQGAITGYKEDIVFLGQAFLRSPNGDIFPTFDVYGAFLTESQGMPTNASENVVGYSLDQSFVYHAFLRKANGTIKQFIHPDAGLAPGQGTQAYAINSANWIVGTYADPDPNKPFPGYVRSSANIFTTFNAIGAVLTNPTDINPSGWIVGYDLDENFAYHGFLLFVAP